MRYICSMKHRIWLWFLCGLFSCVTLQAQTIIELKKGGRVRSKTLDDYRQPARQLVESDGQKTADSVYFNKWVIEGMDAMSTDSLKRARTCFVEALRLMPKHKLAPQLHYYVGLLDENRGEAREALRHYDAALQLNEGADMDMVRMRRAYVCYELGRLPEARRACDELIDRHAQDTALLFLRASVAMDDRRYTDARRDLENLLVISPNHVNAWVCLAHVNNIDGRPQQAMEQFNRAVLLAPTDADVLMARAGAARERKLYGLARADLDVAIKAHPERADLYVQRAALWIDMKEKRAALSDLDKAVSLGTLRSSLLELYQAAQ